MDVAFELPGALSIVTAAERPDLWTRVETADLFSAVWPEYNGHGDLVGEYFGALMPRFGDLQVMVVDREAGDVVGRGRTIPFRWDGDLDSLPTGIDALGLRAFEQDHPTSLSALAAEVVPARQRQGISALIIKAMAETARQHGLAPLVAPVRPSWKDRYPLVPIHVYATWRDSHGLPFDPWMRVHARLGAHILRPEPQSLRITAPVSDWEAWTGETFSDEGSYIFPGGLAPLEVRGSIGRYWEPNVWMLHEVPPL